MNDDANKKDSFFVDTSIIIDESKNNNNNKQLLVSNDSSIDENKIDSLANDIYSDLIDDVLFGLMLQVHRASRLGYLFYMDPDSDPEFEKQFDIYDDNDVLGVFSHLNENFKVSTSGRSNQGSGSNNNNLIKYECVCPNCDRNVAAIRFAPHLEKCMGMGRSSSRIATRRIANYNDTANYNELDQLIEATGLIPNHHHHSNNNTNNNNNNRSNDSYQTNVITAKTNDNDLISIINSVATATMPNSEAINPTSSCCSSVVDIDVSSNSSSCSINNNNNNSNNSSIKQRAAKKRKTQKNLTNLLPVAPTGSNNNSIQLSTNVNNSTNNKSNGSNLRTIIN